MATAPLVNGSTAAGMRDINEVAEYEKILKLRDEIFAGTHPRLAIPKRAPTKVPPLPSTQSPSVPHIIAPSYVSVSNSSQLPGLGRGSEEPSQERSGAFIAEAPNTLSNIDPISLTSSDDLVKEELQRLRQRLEKALKDQFEQKRLEARKRPAQGEGKPDFDVAAVLSKVQDVVKPDITSSSGEDASGSSFDENSLYSSRAPDSTPEAGELEEETASPHRNSFADAVGANGSVETRAHPESFSTGVQLRANNSEMEYDPLNPVLAGFSRNVDIVPDHDDEEDEEGEYSPPEAMDHVPTSIEQHSQPPDPRSRPLRRYSDVENGGPRSPQDGSYRTVRDHTTFPAWPPPFGALLLAEAKETTTIQNMRTRNGRNNQRPKGDRSPEPPVQGLHPRKKRKLDKQAGRRRRNGGGSPDVKNEPVSPPPFHDVQPLGSGRLRSTGNEPILIEDGPQEVHYMRANEHYLDSPTRPMSHMVEPVMPYSEPRSYSRSAMRPVREDTNLRRMASLQSMRAEQPQYVEQVFDSPSRPRATSYVPVVDSPLRAETLRYAQDSPSTYEHDRAQTVRVVRTPATPYHEMYQGTEPEIRFVSQPMPPPPPPPPPQPIERIIIDEQGRKFREIIQERPSDAPRATPIYADRERMVYDSYYRPRATSVMMASEFDDHHTGNMLPPPPSSRMARQVAEPLRQEVYSGRAVSVAAMDRPVSRQTVYLENGQNDRAPVRVSSVRPMPQRYEERAPPQVLSSASSVRPVAREGSVFVDDRSQLRPEYIQMGTPQQYQMTTPQSRYVDAQGREVIMEGGHTAGARYYQGY